MPKLGDTVIYKAGDNLDYAAIVVRVFDDRVALNVFDQEGGRTFMPVVNRGPAVAMYQTLEDIAAAEAAEATIQGDTGL